MYARALSPLDTVLSKLVHLLPLFRTPVFSQRRAGPWGCVCVRVCVCVCVCVCVTGCFDFSLSLYLRVSWSVFFLYRFSVPAEPVF